MNALRPLAVFAGLIALWQAIVWAAGLPPFILPAPARVAATLAERWDFLFAQAAITLLEMALGLVAGATFGALCALALAQVPPLRRWLLPVVIASQAVPIFAIAPLLVIWFGYGIASKVVAAALVIFFAVTSTFYDGLTRTERGFLDLARVMGASPWRLLVHVRVPAALPALASGLRVAAVIAPIGAVIGEWVGASAGLGFVMLHANARMQTDLMFAALFILGVVGVALYHVVDLLLRRLIPWQPVTVSQD
ncbi:MAG: ABC transporter permease [Alphaproteobacteria bacterium]|nr:ABC transporter permease [Alphaproteobacteria bacterium]